MKRRMKRRTQTLAVGGFALLVALALLAGLLACGARGPAVTVQTFYRAVEDGRLDVAVDQLSSSMVDTMGREKLKTALREMTKQVADKGGIDRIEILTEEVTGEVAEVAVRVTYGNGTTDEEEVDLAKEDGEWKIQFSK